MDEIEKKAREQLMLWSGQIDVLIQQRADLLAILAENLEKISDPVVRTAFYQILAFSHLTDRLNGLQTVHSSLDHLLQYHDDEGIDGRHGYH